VAQVATGIARAANLCVPLVEAIALAHDCGHGPAGHASEDAFAPYLPGGYDHAVYGADVTLEPLNLCVQTLDGVRNHSWRRPPPATPEGEVVAWADRIAYVCHDFEDACRAGILTSDDLPVEVTDVVGTRRSAQIGAFVLAVLDGIDRTGRVAMTQPAAWSCSACGSRRCRAGSRPAAPKVDTAWGSSTTMWCGYERRPISSRSPVSTSR
jgi:dGTPase